MNMNRPDFSYAEDVAFFSRAKETCQEPNQNYDFSCPICGGSANVSRKNGMMHAKCSDCGINC